MLRSRRPDQEVERAPLPADERDRLREQVHGRRLTCAHCGASAMCDLTTIRVVTGMDRQEHRFGVCPTCATDERAGKLDRRAAARVLNLADPDAEYLDAVTVERYASRAWSSPTMPNIEPWDHLDRQALARRVEARRYDLERRRGGPCWWCGTTLTSRRHGWRTTNVGGTGVLGPQVVQQCGACTYWLSHSAGPAARDLAASVLIGQSDDITRHHPIGLGQMVRLLWWGETGATEGSTRPFAHLDLIELHARALARRAYFRDVPDQPPRRIEW